MVLEARFFCRSTLFIPCMPMILDSSGKGLKWGAAAAKGEAPPGLPLKGAGQDSSDTQPKVTNGGVPKASDALSGELWEVKKERICKASVYGKLPGWDLRSVIVKSGDDCRQEHLAVQLISHFYGR
ncbi:Phosphatidylinositol 4-kinase beta 1 [Vitis vinifera]|uniref:Phosphatidylinositol 4-kinase beta 1 n=1 Tax=Vitis vinifera TaxID=29760 RepID=A0A438HQV4_VITVI|nr:Phosphatidylinositol 4-kinase beta 1 [Vitis vinifera]